MKKFLSALLVAAMAVSLVACGGSGSESTNSGSGAAASTGAQTSSDGTEVYTIAMATALTDFMAEVGTEFLHSVEMACEEINAANDADGINWHIQVEAFDEKCDVTEATLVSQRIASEADKYLVVFGHLFSSTTLACMQTYHDAGLPLFVPTANSDEIQGDDVLVMVLPAKVQGPQVAACGINNCGMKKIGLVYAMSDYGVAMADEFGKISKEAGAEIAVSESYTAGTDKDFSAILTKIESEGCDGVILIGDYNEGSMIISQAGSIPYFNDNNIPFVSDAAMFSDTFLERVAGSGLEDQIFLAAGYNPYSPDENYQKFNENFYNKYGVNTTEPVVYGYDMTNIVAKALREGATKENLMSVIREMTFDDLVVASGEVKFQEDSHRNATNISVITVADGKFSDSGEYVDMTGINY